MPVSVTVHPVMVLRIELDSILMPTCAIWLTRTPPTQERLEDTRWTPRQARVTVESRMTTREQCWHIRPLCWMRSTRAPITRQRLEDCTVGPLTPLR